MKQNRILVAALIIGAVITACGKGNEGASSNEAAPAASNAETTAASGAGGAPAATPTGKIVTVELNSDAQGNYFKPASFEVHRGDVIRFTLKSGVHNVHFLPDSNAGKSNLPPASDMLQLPDQTLDIPVNFAPGTYYFQCDPHAALGMKGHVKVEQE
ncbi:MAG TPA: plastocyanin/azurin family copper-binding protein [Candidatus Elarobacter sp.]|nr:plastocyanin/azurin family copper-binding protein [Candidatus Elarobacter sp.]